MRKEDVSVKTIDQLDRNMAIATRVEEPDIVWRNAGEAPFRICGLYEPQAEGPFRRMPENVAKRVSEGVAQLALNTAGGRVRFRTDSPYVAIHAEMNSVCRMDHMAFTGIFGFDLYGRKGGEEVYLGTFRPPVDLQTGYESKIALPDGGEWDVTIYFPLYNNVDRLWIGLKEGCALAAPCEYEFSRPVVFYGSSITQGGCASRPGNSFAAIASRMLDCDHVNLGFSGSAKGEAIMAEYIAGLPMCAFVLDYDHNAPSVEHLRATHEPFFQTVRAANPDLPILLVSKPDVNWRNQADALERRTVILDTYQHALAAGDRHVAFLDGFMLFDGPMRDSCTVDGCHPNDLGMMRMGAKMAGALSALLV